MRDFHRNPIFYYLIIPLLIGVWPLLVWAVYLPAAERDRESDYRELIEAQTQIMGILEIDPDRMNTDPNRVVGEFAYGKAVDRAANLCSIPATHCIVSAGPPTTIGARNARTPRSSSRTSASFRWPGSSLPCNRPG